MSKKNKISEINDIIDSSYTEPDYSYGNDNYDEINVYRNINRHQNLNGGSCSGNSFSKITTARAPNSNTSNIFMKYTSASTSATIHAENVDKHATHIKEIKNVEDEFPSLGGCSIQNKKHYTPLHAPMNFKKIVETKKTIEVQPQVFHPTPKHDDYYNSFKAYEEVKYYSEKKARSKIYSTAYSDDEDRGDDDDDDDDDDYN
jgi:hypothetical protein